MKKAFTLVEMLIVIVIIGILAAALIPKLTGVQGRARDVARKADANQIVTALATYKLDNNIYFTGATDGTDIDITGGSVLSALVTQGLLKSLPTEKQTGLAPYKYRPYLGGSVYAITVVSEGGGVNANWATGGTTAYPAHFASAAVAGVTSSASISQALCKQVIDPVSGGGIGYGGPNNCQADISAGNGKRVVTD